MEKEMIDVKTYVRKLIVVASLGGLTAFLGATRLGLVPWFSGVSITILHIPTIIGAILEGPIVGLGIGLIFGLFSLYQANISPVLFDAFFRNPLVSVLPRLIFPFIAWGLYALVSKWKKYPAIVVSSIVSTFFHTVMVLGMLVLTAGSGALTGGEEGVSLWAVFGTIMLGNGIPEMIAGAIISSLVIGAWLGIEGRKKKPKLSDEA